MVTPRILFSLCFLLLVSCSGQTENKSDDQNSAIPSSPEESAMVELKLINSLDSITLLVNSWNDAINNFNDSKLISCYDNQVQYYLKLQSKEDIVKSKMKWLNDHQKYTQKIKIWDVCYPSENKGIVRCLFSKMYSDDGAEKAVDAVLDIRLIDGDYKIIKETDMITELNIIKKEPAIDLPKGIYTYELDYLSDTRDPDEGLVHDFVRYSTSITIKNEDSLQVYIESFSGRTRERTSYHIRNIQLMSGYLSFEGAIYWVNNPKDPDEEDFDFVKFKLLKNCIAVVQGEGMFQYRIGMRYW